MNGVELKSSLERRRLKVNGLVQGVGFRPFVFRLASELQLSGWVANNSQGVVIEVEGDSSTISLFVKRLLNNPPPLARITNHAAEVLPPTGQSGFQIDLSHARGSATTMIPPDIGLCNDCLRELFDESDRRFRYPFINCTNCGPRYTIIGSLPYDRPNTSMSSFEMCSVCQTEYNDPADRRFHAQPIACPDCGPIVWLHDRKTEIETADPITETVRLLKEGKIVAIKGLGGFHLAVDATNDEAVTQLRRRKGRDQKPFAIMADSLETVRPLAHTTPAEEAMLTDCLRPILILPAKTDQPLSNSVSSDNRDLGIMLPYTPLHELIMRGNFEALVMTSGNRTDEPIAIDNDEALAKLNTVADYFLLHNRTILRRCDDSIVKMAESQIRPIRRARGYVPSPVLCSRRSNLSVLAVGGELKNAIALSRNDEVFFGPHIGDLDNPRALDFFKETITHLSNTLEIEPGLIACDLHPEYLSTKWAAEQTELPVIQVQHHHAHLASVLAENGCETKAIGLILDGTGYGTDGTVWGGEILVGDAASYERFAWLDQLPMPGGAIAIKQPWRMALSYQLMADHDLVRDEVIGLPSEISQTKFDNLRQIISNRINSPMTSSCGRLFDGVAAMLGLCSEIGYEAQAAIRLETEARQSTRTFSTNELRSVLPGKISGSLKLGRLINRIRELVSEAVATPDIARYFHYALVELFVEAVKGASQVHNLKTVALSGGVFQNRLLFETISERLNELGFDLLSHRQLPTNDGGLALGQVAIARVQHDRQSKPSQAELR